MKTQLRTLFALLLVAATTVSCEEWLKIEPEYEVTDTDLYKNTAGYYKVVNGLYYQLASFSLYGKELTWGMADVWARCYRIDPASDYKAYPQMYRLEYEAKEAKEMASAIWSAGYKIIAQANDLIAHAEAADAGFFALEETDRNTILGEAYAIRALMHFDLLRLFAPSIGADPEGRYVAYVDRYPSTVNPPIPSRAFADRVIEDLVRARELLETFDVKLRASYATSTAYRFASASVPPEGRFYSCRGMRLNYYAVTGLLARACLWAGRTDDALTYAQEIIDLVTAKTLALSKSNAIAGDPKLTDETLFGFYNEKLVETYEPFINADAARRLPVDDPTFFTTPSTDQRKNFVNADTEFMKRYTVKVSDEKDCIVPHVRISEAYYIAAECLYASDPTQAVADLMAVRKARGYSSPALKPADGEQKFVEALIYEYRKEFLGEGQLLFFFKRTGYPIAYSEGNFNHQGKLTLPIPDSESAI